MKNKQESILIVLPNDNLGGAEQYLKMVAEHYYKLGYRIEVFFLKKEIYSSWTYLESKDFVLHFTKCEKERFGFIALLKKIVKRKKRYKYIYTSHVHINSFIALLRKLNIVKADYHIGRESSSPFKRYTGFKLLTLKFYYTISYRKIDLLICQTDYMYKQLIEGLPSLFKDMNIKVIPNPIDLNILKDDYDSSIVPYNNYIVSAGRLIYEKGFDVLIRSFSLLKNDFENLKLVILGRGRLKDELESIIHELDLDNDVYLHGFAENVYPFFKKADLCVVSSRIEGFPNVLLQMMSQNDKVVSTLCAGGIKDIKGVEIAEVNNIDSLYSAMKNILTIDSSKNRVLYDRELKERSIEKFIDIVGVNLLI